MTINTLRRLFQYIRLPLGVASAQAIFQRHIGMFLQGIKGVRIYLDDVLIAGSTREEHLHRLAEVFKHLQNAGMRLN